jgi:hypothetical protein
MPQKDYFERAIESFARMVAFILGRADAGDYDRAQLTLEEAAERFVGLSLKALDPLSFEGLRSLLWLGGDLDLDRCLMLADLRALEGRLRDGEGNATQGVRCYSVALRLYMEAVDLRGFTVLGGREELAEATAERLQELEVEPEAASALMRFLAAGEEDLADRGPC